jgi:hypothetical protein
MPTVTRKVPTFTAIQVPADWLTDTPTTPGMPAGATYQGSTLILPNGDTAVLNDYVLTAENGDIKIVTPAKYAASYDVV